MKPQASSLPPVKPAGARRLLALGGTLLMVSLLPVTAYQGQASAAPIAVGSDAGTSTDAYILGPGDQVQLELLDPVVKDLGGTFEILNDGSAGLALLGSVVLEGLTLNQASQWLTRLYGRYLRRPDLNLRVVRPRPIQVSVVGEVETPGLYSLSASEESQAGGGGSTSISGLPTVVSAIRKAGGITLNANLTDVVLRRSLPGATDQLKERRLDLSALLREGDKRQNPFLFDGDTVVIGKAEALDPDIMELAATNLSPEEIQVNVIGEVVNPGRLPLPARTPLVQAILAAGGPATFRARRSDVELVRINRNGTATRELFTLDYNQGVSGPFNPPLRDGDTVIVNRSAYARFADALGAIGEPLLPYVFLYDLFNDD